MCPKDTEEKKDTENKKITIKTDPIVREELNRWKREDETYNDVLKRRLAILPQSLDELTAFYPPELKTGAEIIIQRIRNEYDLGFEEVIRETDNGNHVLEFNSAETGYTILKANFRESSFNLAYRNEVGKMESLVGVAPPTTEGGSYVIGPKRGRGGGDYVPAEVCDPIDLEPGLGEKIEGSYERWGKKNE